MIVAKEDAKYVIAMKAKEVEEASSVPWRRTRLGSRIPAPSPSPRALRSRTLREDEAHAEGGQGCLACNRGDGGGGG
jgi:hypothetical protein